MAKDISSHIILASKSPRRRQLLSEAGYDFIVIPPDIDESSFDTDRVEASEFAKRLALAKAKDVAHKHPDSLIIGADTIVDFDGQIIGKPADAKDTERITKKLFSAPHKVITGIALVRCCDAIEVVDSDTTTVYPKKITAEQISEHIKSGSWQDKAGAYAIKETGDEFIEKIDGSLTNVMGLPMELIENLLKEIE